MKRDKLTKEIHGETGDDADRIVSVVHDAYTTFNSKCNNQSNDEDVAAEELSADFEATLLELGFGEDPDEDEEDEEDGRGDRHPYLMADVYKEG